MSEILGGCPNLGHATLVETATLQIPTKVTSTSPFLMLNTNDWF